MGKYKWLAKMGGIVAIASVIFLPMVNGCGSQPITGVDILQSNEIGGIIKIFLAVSLLCAAAAIFLKAAIPILASGAVGLAALITAYLMAKSAASVELKSGAYFIIASFVIILISGFLRLGTNIFGEKDP